MGSERIFVYGTLRRGATRDATKFFEGVVFAATARVRGRLFDFGDYPGLRLDDSADWVIGELIDVDESALVHMDAWEGISPAGSGEYLRVRAEAERDDGTVDPCWVYEVSAAFAARRAEISSGDWLEHAPRP